MGTKTRIHLEKTNVADIIMPIVGIECQVIDLDCRRRAILVDNPFHIGIQGSIIHPLLQDTFIDYHLLKENIIITTRSMLEVQEVLTLPY